MQYHHACGCYCANGPRSGPRQSIASFVSPAKAIFVLLLARCKQFAKAAFLAHQDGSLGCPRELGDNSLATV
jgi:hypothetical protein